MSQSSPSRRTSHHHHGSESGCVGGGGGGGSVSVDRWSSRLTHSGYGSRNTAQRPSRIRAPPPLAYENRGSRRGDPFSPSSRYGYVDPKLAHIVGHHQKPAHHLGLAWLLISTQKKREEFWLRILPLLGMTQEFPDFHHSGFTQNREDKLRPEVLFLLLLLVATCHQELAYEPIQELVHEALPPH